MIYYKDLQTNNIIEFGNPQQIGIGFSDKTKFECVKDKQEINDYLLLKAKNSKIQEVLDIKSNFEKEITVKNGITISGSLEWWNLNIQKMITRTEDKNLKYIEVYKKSTLKIKQINLDIAKQWRSMFLQLESDVAKWKNEKILEINSCKTIKDLEKIDLGFSFKNEYEFK